jgi:CRP/FNR family cyclic AMP-dependent transcriptional regulator
MAPKAVYPLWHEALQSIAWRGWLMAAGALAESRRAVAASPRGWLRARAALAASFLLSRSGSDEVDRFMAIVDVVEFAPGGVVWAEGDRARAALLVVAGRIATTRPSHGDRDAVFGFAGPGEFLGELCLFDPAPRQSRAYALQPSLVASMDRSELLRWFEEHPAVCQAFCAHLSARVRQVHDTLEDAQGADVGTRLARAIVRLGVRFGRPAEGGIRLDVELPQEEWAMYVHASRERVNRVLVDFRRRGWLAGQGRELVIRDAPALVRRARLRDEVLHRLGAPSTVAAWLAPLPLITKDSP